MIGLHLFTMFKYVTLYFRKDLLSVVEAVVIIISPITVLLLQVITFLVEFLFLPPVDELPPSIYFLSRWSEYPYDSFLSLLRKESYTVPLHQETSSGKEHCVFPPPKELVVTKTFSCPESI